MRGESSLSIVNSFDFSVKHIHNFWKFDSEEAKGYVVGIDAFAKKIVGLGVLDGEDVQTVHVFDGGEGVISFEVSDFDDSGKKKLFFFSNILF